MFSLSSLIPISSERFSSQIPQPIVFHIIKVPSGSQLLEGLIDDSESCGNTRGRLGKRKKGKEGDKNVSVF